jgi:hypothetical protein
MWREVHLSTHIFSTAGVKSARSYYIPWADPGGRYLAGIVGSNPAGGMDASLLSALYVVK